jgi:Protein of unknown function (DUF1488)
MKVVFPWIQPRAVDARGAVWFAAEADDVIVSCEISRDALARLDGRGADGAAAQADDLLAQFLARRPAVEGLTRALIEAGRVDEDGRLLITGDDAGRATLSGSRRGGV